MNSIRQGIINELYRPARKNFKRRRIYLHGIDDVWQVSSLIYGYTYLKVNFNKYLFNFIDRSS